MIYGAGDGNRTHVRSLGSFYTAIVRRPLVLNLIDYMRLSGLRPSLSIFPIFQNLLETMIFWKMLHFHRTGPFWISFMIMYLEKPDPALIASHDRHPNPVGLRMYGGRRGAAFRYGPELRPSMRISLYFALVRNTANRFLS